MPCGSIWWRGACSRPRCGSHALPLGRRTRSPFTLHPPLPALAQVRSAGFGNAFASEVGSDGGGGGGEGGGGGRRLGGKGSGGKPHNNSHNRRVEFRVIQELKVTGTVQFSPCSSDISDQSFGLLAQVAAVLSSRPHMCVRVEGHTDNAPMWGGGGNLELSQGRARSIREHLVEKGGAGQLQLVSEGFGELAPLTPNVDRAAKARNRRVEFHILGRESQLNLRALTTDPAARARISTDPRTLAELKTMAANGAGVKMTNAGGGGGGGGGMSGGTQVPLPLQLRQTAADVLLAVGSGWEIERLLWAAVVKNDPQQCPAAAFNRDVIRMVMRWCLLLGCCG